MIPLKALWKIDVAARKQEASSAIAVVRLGGWALAMALWWWFGDISNDQILLVIAAVESVAALLRAVLPDRFDSLEPMQPPITTDPATRGMHDNTAEVQSEREAGSNLGRDRDHSGFNG